jgi:hypothetical protein
MVSYALNRQTLWNLASRQGVSVEMKEDKLKEGGNVLIFN